MTEWHPDPEEIELFLDDELPTEASRAVQRHLFSCPRCEERMIALLPGPKDPLGDDADLEADLELDLAEELDESPRYEGLIHSVLQQAQSEMERRETQLHRERTEAEASWHELAPLSDPERLALVEGEPRFQSWGLFELLLETGKRELDRPQEALDLLRLALAIADQLDTGRYGLGSVEAAKSRAWVYVGNALRIQSDFRAADRAFTEAEEHLSRSWLDPLDEALVYEYKASLRRAQGRFAEAIELLDQAIVLYREVNEPHFQGRSLITKGLVLQYAGETDLAAEDFRNGLFLIHPADEPRLVVAAHHGLIHCANDNGRYAEARALIQEARPVWDQVGKRLDLLRLRWLEGKVALGLGQHQLAEQAFLEVRNEFIDAEIAHDAALASLNLAEIYLRQGRLTEVKHLAAEILPIFRARDVYRETLTALLYFQQAAEREQATLSVVKTLETYLKKASYNPGLVFRGEEIGLAASLPS